MIGVQLRTDARTWCHLLPIQFLTAVIWVKTAVCVATVSAAVQQPGTTSDSVFIHPVSSSPPASQNDDGIKGSYTVLSTKIFTDVRWYFSRHIMHNVRVIIITSSKMSYHTKIMRSDHQCDCGAAAVLRCCCGAATMLLLLCCYRAAAAASSPLSTLMLPLIISMKNNTILLTSL